MLELIPILLSTVALAVAPSESKTSDLEVKSQKTTESRNAVLTANSAADATLVATKTEPSGNNVIDVKLDQPDTQSSLTRAEGIVANADMKSNIASQSSYTGAEGYLTQKADDIASLTKKIFDTMPHLPKDSLFGSMSDAYKTNPQIKQQIAVVRSSVEKIVQAKSGWRPSVTATLSQGLSQANNKGDTLKQQLQSSNTGVSKSQKDANASAKLELRQNLFAGGQTVYQVKESEAAYQASKATLTETEQNVLLQVSTSYMQLMSKYAEIELLKRNEVNLYETLKATQDKFDVGEETRTSVAQAEAQLADGIAQRINAEAELEQIKATFEKTTFRKAGRLTRPDIPKTMPKTLDEVIEKSRVFSPTLSKAMYAEKSSRYAVDRATGALLPSIDLVGSSSASRDRLENKYVNSSNALTVNPRNDRSVNHSVQVQMSIPLYEGGRTRSQRREASEAAEQSRIQIEQARREIVERAVGAWNRYKSAESRIVEYKKQVQANLISLDGTQQELLVGSKILLDVLNAISRLVQSQVNLVRAEQDYLSAAYEVLFVTGQLTAKSLGLHVNLYDPDVHYQETANRF